MSYLSILFSIHKRFNLVNLYEKNLMHICESSKLILQNICYDIPNFEKTIQGNEKNC